MKSRIWNSWIHRTGLCVGFLLLFSFILTPLAPAVSFPDYSPGAGAVSLDYPLLKNGQVLHEEIAGFEWTDTPTGPAAYRVKVWQEDTPRVDENDPDQDGDGAGTSLVLAHLGGEIAQWEGSC